MKYWTLPITNQKANEFVAKHHRHHTKTPWALFSVAIGLRGSQEVIGVAILGRPVSRHQCDGRTVELARLCILEGYRNACSFLMGRVAKITDLMGYERLLTYTLEEEFGASLKASNWTMDGLVKGMSWSNNSRPRVDKHPTTDKKRWIKHFNNNKLKVVGE